MLRAMTAKALLEWIKHHNAEPFGDIAAGLRTGLLAIATGNCDVEKIAAEDFIVAEPTPGQEKDRKAYDEQVAEFESIGRLRRIAAEKAKGT